MRRNRAVSETVRRSACVRTWSLAPAPRLSSWRFGARTAVCALVAVVACATTFNRDARADAADGAHDRPAFDVSIGMGVSLDHVGLSDGRTVAVPSFEAQAGAGAGTLGFEARLFSSAADGRYHHMTAGVNDMAVDRLDVDAMVAWRPLFVRFAGRDDELARGLRALTFDVGIGGENASVSQKSTMRYGFVVGGHVDIPLTPANDPSELRFRLCVRRLLANAQAAGTVSVTDSRAEVFGGLAFVF